MLFNHSKLKSIILKNTGVIKYDEITDINKYEKGENILVELKGFGFSQVYSLISIDKLKEFANKIGKQESDIPVALSISRVYKDSPIVEGFNKKSKEISINNLSIDTWISLYQLNSIINGMNQYSESPISNQLEYEFDITMPNNQCIFLDFKKEIDYKYIFVNSDYEEGYDTYTYGNTLKNLHFSSIYIKIPEFNLWQKIGYFEFNRLKNLDAIDIRYAVTDAPRCFSNVGYSSEFYASSFNELLPLCIYVPMDIYFNKVFSKNETLMKLENRYDAIEICIHNEDYNTTVLLTHKELGIEFNGETSSWYHDKKKLTRLQYMDEFCLLTLIRNVSLLKPY